MIDEIVSAIVYKLKDLFPDEVRKIRRYTDDIPQDFKTPAFVIFQIDQDYEKRINTKYKGRIGFDVAYFSDRPIPEIKSDCRLIQKALLRGFDYFGVFKALNKNARITDNVLHMTFDVNYSEIKEDIQIPMQKQTTIQILKKEG